MAINMRKLLEGMVKVGASDLHLKVGNRPTIRLNGVLRQIDHPPLSLEDSTEVNTMMMPERCRAELEKKGSVDYSYGLPNIGRFRVNAYHQRGTLSLAIRIVEAAEKDFASLNLPAVISEMVRARTGLILVTGITGCGKSTTLSAMINHINNTRREHIICIEDPIEYLYMDNKSVIEQIEVGSDISDFPSALRSALRQDPDIIQIGEMRDKETVETAIHCTETGHLVLSTLHTTDAKQTISRLLHFFPSGEHELVNEQLAQNLRGVISQRLMRTVEGKSRVPCCEILIGTPIVQKLISDGRYDDLQQVLQNRDEGMQSFEAHLVELVKGGIVPLEDAVALTGDEMQFKRMMDGRLSGSDRRSIVGSGGY